MIPRTSIDEANRHLQQLHKRVHDLEITVQDQRDALLNRDKLLHNRLAEVSSLKEKEIEGLTNKLMASERTVSVLQEELERKNQHILTLQHSHARLRRLLNFKDDIHDLLKTMDDAEENLAIDEGDTDGLLSFYQRSRETNPSFSGIMPGKKIRKKKFVRSENSAVAMSLENGNQSDIEAVPTNLGGKEFYL